MTKHPILICIFAIAACGEPETREVDWVTPDMTGSTDLPPMAPPVTACASGRGTVLTQNAVACMAMPSDAPSAACGTGWGPCRSNPVPQTCAALGDFYIAEPSQCPLPAGALFGCGSLGKAIGTLDSGCGGFYRIPCPKTPVEGNPYHCVGGSVVSTSDNAGVLCCRGGQTISPQ